MNFQNSKQQSHYFVILQELDLSHFLMKISPTENSLFQVEDNCSHHRGLTDNSVPPMGIALLPVATQY